jgi:hypothetical protein
MFTGSEKDGGGNKVSSEIIRQLEEKIRIQNEELRQQNQEIQRLQEVARQREAEINNLRRELSQGGNQRGFGGYSQPAMGKVVCTKGVAKGTGLSLPEDKKVVVGKNPQSSNLVINNPKVSNIHCSVRYVPASNTYIVKDHSKNGTYINGQRLQNGVPITLHAGTVLSLADGSDEITLG